MLSDEMKKVTNILCSTIAQVTEEEIQEAAFAILCGEGFTIPPLIHSNDILFLSSVFQVLGVEGVVKWNGDTVALGYDTKYGNVFAYFSIETMRKYYNRASAFISEVL